MACLPTPTHGELEFVHELVTRDLGQCRGPLLRITFRPYRVSLLELIMNSTAASDVLWDGFQGESYHGLHFERCAAHWMDLAALCGLRAAQYRRVDWSTTADRFMENVCTTAGWDTKEIVNLIAWQGEKLT